MSDNHRHASVMRRTETTNAASCSFPYIIFFSRLLHHLLPLCCLPPGVAAVPFLNHLLLCKINFPPAASPPKCFISLMFCLTLFISPQLLQRESSVSPSPPPSPQKSPHQPLLCTTVTAPPSGRAPECRPFLSRKSTFV